ncbi:MULTISPECIES: tetratricopeptide repeat protein [unclassified Bradyrhizobium]|uniref:tetratricopeptide repeat protein n=1 Tax=unclassified Bradyrhizobium TaxID=2631580 RepID=UPI001BAB68B4|nr:MULTISPECIES: tetratricopeptide repeat protein [unclassified Bradyrhizobium]MBR1202635.1 tetratricopeptide repeat protein [Bradyrhizobium sp. AUGA SZCCT0124]MBR1314049.1 tetratricopeptide repeat protein [Bradyrhizobium sp. AUGA SZCCT0051]MBR1342933.1 tetratricopeptide repeat protein [Bradyrhizobium sp. AUGA SZCCT0105]MBR1353162.1 tetratricopeptide repeat protein [Bradyrhizobium sp. AUGA SZCCT0045]
MLSTRFNRLTIAVLAAAALAVPAQLSAQTPDHPTDNAAQFPSKTDLKSLTTAGSYLAARHASVERDAASAAAFYRSALRTDPKNSELLDRAFISSLADGDIDEAVKLADRILTQDKANRVARLVVGVRDLKLKKYAAAQSNINQSVRGPITDLVATLLSAWAAYGAGDSKGAVASIDKLTGPEWYPIFKDLHAGMIYELSGKEKDAGARFEKVFKLDDSMLRTVDEYARWTSRNKEAAAATAMYEAFDKKLPRHPLVLEGIKETKAGKKLPPLIDSPQAGAAEALYGIGATLTRRGGEDLALVYLQLALYLQPNHPLALLSLADLYESVKKPQMAIKVYERMPASSPLKRNAQIQLATNLDAADRSDEAIKILKEVTSDQPKDIEAILALGNIERGRKKFADCATTYSQAIDALPVAGGDKNAWVTYYYRGICEERSKQWNKAEADMRKALELQPEQPHVLNYLGYSWIDQGINLDEGMKMIKRAVDQRPDDGYIVDSLGWAYYRIGNYDEAVKNLERAIDLKPEDPTINDHLGDAYWRVGRTLEARFQWAHARDLKPEPEELPKIQAKIDNGLPDDTSNAASADKKKDDDGKGG